MWRIFKESNDINEHSVAAFIALGLVVIIALSVLILGILGTQLSIPEFIFISLLTFSASALGVAGYKSVNNDGKGEQNE
jgi:hypothetical protein